MKEDEKSIMPPQNGEKLDTFLTDYSFIITLL